MARDAALFEAFERGEIPPTLRVYEWASPAITYGYAQQLPERLVRGAQALGIPLFRRPTGGKAVLHGHDLTIALISTLPLPSGERVGMREQTLEGEPPASREKHPLPSDERERTRLYPRQVYLWLAPALIRAFERLDVPATLGSAPPPDPLSLDDGGDCFATPAITDIVHAETGIKLMGCALRVSERGFLMQASIPLRLPSVPVEAIFGHAHPAPPPLPRDALIAALFESLDEALAQSSGSISGAAKSS
jgi:lipoate-protein ligase A